MYQIAAHPGPWHTAARPARPYPRRAGLVTLLLIASLSLPAPAGAVETTGRRDLDLADLSLEELLNIEVTSAGRKAQLLSEAAAALFVITRDDIRRAGVTTLPDALRLAPGIEVGRIDASKWAVSARGFNGRFANKLLVLMDGRTLYTPLFSGVHWDQHDVMLEDVDRIEVIRGPGAALWGSNAVNGVINIITRPAWETQGGLLSLSAGDEERATAGLRYGGTTAGGTAWRMYAKAFDRDAAATPDGGRASDDWRMLRGGFRADGRTAGGHRFAVLGDLYHGSAGETLTRPSLVPSYAVAATDDVPVSGASLLGRLTLNAGGGITTLQAYYDRVDYDALLAGETRDTLDLEFQRQSPYGERHELVWGLGYRVYRDEVRPGVAAMLPAEHTGRLFSAFVQDEYRLDENLHLIFGGRLEHNEFTGWEVQPTLRGLWRPDPQQTWWAAVSRAVRTPARADTQSRADLLVMPPLASPLPVLAEARGNPEQASERLLAYELGWRLHPNPALALDVTGFWHDYDRLRSQELGALEFRPAPLPHLVLPNMAGNLLAGQGYGVEVVLEARPRDDWRLQAIYSELRLDLEARPGSVDAVSVGQIEGRSPRRQASLRSEWSITPRTDFDAWLKYVGALPDLGIDAYTSLSLRLAWRPRKDLELALVGQNLLEDRHEEFLAEFVGAQATAVERSVHATLRYSF